MKEVWEGIKGYEAYYAVSNFGRVKSLLREGTQNQFSEERILKLRKDKYGYLRCNLCYKGKRTYPTIHRLVAEAFIPNPDNKPQVNHKDGNKEFNFKTNLEWMTAKENIYHRDTVLNKGVKGECHPLAKLCIEDVYNIKTLLFIGVSKQNEISALFNIDVSQISSIKQGKSWRHVL